ncbi:MAG: LCP family protein [Pseudomonadota bacterium]
MQSKCETTQPSGVPQSAASAKHRGKGRFAALALAVLALTALLAGAAFFSLTRTLSQRVQPIEVALDAPAGSAMTVLLIGSDSQGASLDAAREGRASDQRADSLMLVHLPADRKDVYLVSLMRDLWVKVPDHGEAKLNAALALGGVALTVRTVETLLSLPISHVAMVDFEGFRGLTDSLGGIEVDVPRGFASYHLPGEHFAAGPQTMDGTHALAFVRERYAFGNGDFERVRNQQRFLRAVAARLVSVDALASPLKTRAALAALMPYVSLDKAWSAPDVAALALTFAKPGSRQVNLTTLATAGNARSANGQAIIRPDPQAIARLSAAVRTDRMADYFAALAAVPQVQANEQPTPAARVAPVAPVPPINAAEPVTSSIVPSRTLSKVPT